MPDPRLRRALLVSTIVLAAGCAPPSTPVGRATSAKAQEPVDAAPSGGSVVLLDDDAGAGSAPSQPFLPPPPAGYKNGAAAEIQKGRLISASDPPARPKTTDPYVASESSWVTYRAHECYAKRLQTSPGEEGRLLISMRLRVLASEPHQAFVEGSSVSTALRDCVVHALERQVEYRTRDFSDCWVVFAFEFKPS